jgi:methionyl-tRNA synthetase
VSDSSKFQRTLVTSALPYANGHIHLGHIAGAYLPADIYVRYKRLKGEPVLYIGGSDEYGVPITLTALKEGITPQEVIDRYHTANADAFARLGISYDIYGRTSWALHVGMTQALLQRAQREAATSSRKTWSCGTASTSDRFLPDRYVKGTCPKCGYEDANGDECENCGAQYTARELVARARISRATARRRCCASPSTGSSNLPAFQEPTEGLAGQPRGMAQQREAASPWAGRTTCAPAASRATRTGACRSRSKTRPPRASASTCGSTRRLAT